MSELEDLTGFVKWRDRARDYLFRGTPPAAATFRFDGLNVSALQSGFDFGSSAEKVEFLKTRFQVPAKFVELARIVSTYRDDRRWDLLYRVLWRLTHGELDIRDVADPELHQLELMAKAIRRDIHKTHAFVRFKRAEAVGGLEMYVAWYEPTHLTLPLSAPFFERRFGDQVWSIFTPDLSAHWDKHELRYSRGISKSEFHHHDSFDEMWKSYYKSIFNPARLKLKAMQAEMPKKAWANLPEAEVIQDLIRNVPARLQEMARKQNTRAEVPEGLEKKDWGTLKKASQGCTGCPLFKNATQTVFGEGDLEAKILVVGEQPGDQEDLSGLPFVGPAGEVFNRALALADLPRSSLYVTNAVKHFKWKPQGKIRLHQKPSGAEMHACRSWLEREIKIVRPKVILALGATAATSILGRAVKITAERGTRLRSEEFNCDVIVSWHPSAILRAVDDHDSKIKAQQLADDLALAKSHT